MKKFFAICLMAVSSVLVMAQSYPTNVFLTGSATPVGWATAALPMYVNGDGTYEYVGMLYNGEYGNEFKMLGSDDWTPSYGPLVDSTVVETGKDYEIVVRENFDMPDNKFRIIETGRFHLTLNLATNKLTVAAAAEEEADKNGYDTFHPTNLYIVGNGTGAGWSPENSIALTNNNDGTYTMTTTIYGHNGEEEYNEFKFLTKQGWDMPQFGPAEEKDVNFNGVGEYGIKVFVTGDNKFHNLTTETKEYDITVDLVNHKMTVAEHKATGMENVNMVAAKKVMMNGNLYILNNEEIYTATGVRVK